MIPLEDVIREVRRLREVYDALKKQADAAKIAYDKAHLALWERMDATEVHGMKIDGKNFVWNPPKPYGSISDKRLFIEWAEENAPELVEPEPRMSLVNELVRQRIDNGEEMPPGVNFYTKKTVAQRQG